MAIGEDNQSPEPLPDLPDVGGGVMAPRTGGEVKVDFSDDSAQAHSPEIHADSDRSPSINPAPQSGTNSYDHYLGKSFGGYELVEKIGQGGMGVVYKGRQVSLDRTVAVKILNKALYDNQEFIKRFEREAKSIARINHPNIVSVYDFGQSDGHWFMVTEFVEGSSLSRLIADRVMIDPKELAPLMVQCLSGLAHVGQSGIVHRDIKPDNILITKDNIAKIADFGLAKDVSGTNDHTDLTAVGLAMGTPAYMSPEQCMGRRLDGRSDIYALGVTAYFGLTGEKPFVGQSSFEIMTKQREHNPTAPSQMNPRISRECSDLVMRMLAKNPKDRYENAELCRQAWNELHQHLMSARSSMRTGEFEMPPPPSGMQPSKSNRGKIDLPPAPGGPAMAPPPAFSAAPVNYSPPPAFNNPSAADMPPPLPSPPIGATTSTAPAPGDSNRLRRPPTDSHTPEVQPGSESHVRPITERRLRQLGTDAITCPRCGMLNRAELATCSKCGNALRDSDSGENARAQEVEAQRLFEQKNYRESAGIYARLADKEVDRRQRSVLRSKEREVRKLDLEQQVTEVMTRSRQMAERGDMKGAITCLEQASTKMTSDVTASGGGLELALGRELAILRARMRSRKRVRMIVVLIVVIALAVGGFLARESLLRLIHGASPSSSSSTTSSLLRPSPSLWSKG